MSIEYPTFYVVADFSGVCFGMPEADVPAGATVLDPANVDRDIRRAGSAWLDAQRRGAAVTTLGR